MRFVEMVAFCWCLACCAVLIASEACAQGAGARKEAERPEFVRVDEVAGLPRVLLIGDSISMGYTIPVRKLLEGKANVQRIPTNGGPTSRGVENIEEWLGDEPWDVIHFNWGLHDLKRMKDGKVDISGEWQVAPEDYEKNLISLVSRLQATGATLIWAMTTPVPEGASMRIPGDDVEANEIARRVMAARSDDRGRYRAGRMGLPAQHTAIDLLGTGHVTLLCCVCRTPE